MMIVPVPRVADRALAPVSARFALGRAELPVSVEEPSGSTTRPFALRFTCLPDRAVIEPRPPHWYCHLRQIMVTTSGTAMTAADWTPTTLATKDGQGNPQEDWKPDFPFHES